MTTHTINSRAHDMSHLVTFGHFLTLMAINETILYPKSKWYLNIAGYG